MENCKRLQKCNSFQKYIPFVFCVLLVLFLTGGYPLVKFLKEDIAIQVFSKHILLTGIFEYKNPFPFSIMQGFSIPLPIDKNYPEPVQIAVDRLYPDVVKPIPVYFLLGKHRFSITFRPGETLKIHVQYYQYTPQKTACYILTTTQSWKDPLIQGRYSLKLNDSVKLLLSNYPLEMQQPNIYAFEKTNFMPQEDWKFSWSI